MSSLSSAQFRTGATTDAARDRGPELMRSAQNGDRAAYGQLAMLCQDRLFNSILRLVGDRDEARELTQETLLRGLEKIHEFRGDAAPYTWLFRIGMNLAISQLRKVHRHRTFSLDRPGSNGRAGDGENQASALLDRVKGDSSSPSAELESREKHQQVLAALGRLDAEYRAVLVMRDIEGMEYQQMADALDLPLGTLKSRLFRARLALRDELKDYLK